MVLAPVTAGNAPLLSNAIVTDRLLCIVRGTLCYHRLPSCTIHN